ncbi:MAG: hypothetical protein ACREXR_19960 [Gammaproteobacteria bacterium]
MNTRRFSTVPILAAVFTFAAGTAFAEATPRSDGEKQAAKRATRARAPSPRHEEN